MPPKRLCFCHSVPASVGRVLRGSNPNRAELAYLEITDGLGSQLKVCARRGRRRKMDISAVVVRLQRVWLQLLGTN